MYLIIYLTMVYTFHFMQVVNLEHYIKNKIKDVLVNMKEQYIRQETYDDLNEIQKKQLLIN